MVFKISSPFFKAAIVCSFLTVITTLGIHLNLFDFEITNLESKAKLIQNSWWHLEKWWVILHCCALLIVMLAVTILLAKQAKEWSILGFIFLGFFAFVEIGRQTSDLFYLGGLYNNYLFTDNESQRTILEIQIDSYFLISYSLFIFFILSISLSNMFYSLAFWKNNTLLSVLFFIWFLQGLTTIGNEFLNNGFFDEFIFYMSSVYQPLLRLTLAFWLLNQYNNSIKVKPKNSLIN